MVACIDVIMRGVERCQSNQASQKKTATKMPQPKSKSAWRESQQMGEKCIYPQDTPEPRCPISLTTLPALPTNILIRKTSKEKEYGRQSGTVITPHNFHIWLYNSLPFPISPSSSPACNRLLLRPHLSPGPPLLQPL